VIEFFFSFYGKRKKQLTFLTPFYISHVIYYGITECPKGTSEHEIIFLKLLRD